MFIVVFIFCIAGIAMIFIHSEKAQIIYAAIGVVIFTIVNLLESKIKIIHIDNNLI